MRTLRRVARPWLALLAALLAPPLLGGGGAQAAPGEAPPGPQAAQALVSLGTVEIPVQEASGLAILPGATPQRLSLLVVTDEGAYDAAQGALDGALYRLDAVVSEAGLATTPPKPVRLHVRFERFDPGWPAAVSPCDLESLAPLPGEPDLFLLGGERNPEDQTDDGANRLYVVRYPAGAEDRAEVVSYLRVLDQVEDQMNDRFEGVAVTSLEGRADAWRVWLFKERTA